MKVSVICISAVLAVSTAVVAAPAEDKANPCKQIEKACKDAGFVQNKAKKGFGLHRDCINPIMQGKSEVPGATKQLPQIDPNVVAACKAKNPKFGEGKVGTKK